MKGSQIKRVILIILDGVGVGELPDAGVYHDEGTNTLGNLSRKLGGLFLPNLQRFGLGNIIPILGVSPVNNSLASFGKMQELSPGKDSTSGHWEIAGVVLEHPFPTYPNGFPLEVIEPFEKAIGRKIIGNIPASGTKIIKQLGDEHIHTGFPIVYTSADSVFQIACHEEIIPVEELYHYCEIARSQLTGKHGVGRVIARPFVGESGAYLRDSVRRKDYSLPPPEKTILNYLKEKGLPVVGIGKIEDLFASQGLTESIHTKDNLDGLERTLEIMQRVKEGLIFVNLIEFDMLWGHRNDCEGFYYGLQDFDDWLVEVMKRLTFTDILIITADHGCDPTTEGTDHTREYVPLLVYNSVHSGINLGTRRTFADVGATIAQVFEIREIKNGRSFLEELQKIGQSC
ncbi:MAG: phosphopentomutase [Candidatus Edwardsbacteria bacterium]